MASIFSRLRKHGKLQYAADIPEGVLEFYNRANVISPMPVLVNITSYVEGWKGGGYPNLSSIDMTPCHMSMWLEWTWTWGVSSNRRTAIHVLRLDAAQIDTPPNHFLAELLPQARFLVVLTNWTESNGGPYLWSVTFTPIDRAGTYPGNTPCYADEANLDGTRIYRDIATDVLTTMNTRGTRMEPPIPGGPVQIVKPDRWPSSVWHTIHIPRFPHPSQPLNGDVTPEVLEKREHWVRAHRADYRNGKGLFGRIHGLIWVPEHRRGNPELGTVKQSFEVGVR